MSRQKKQDNSSREGRMKKFKLPILPFKHCISTAVQELNVLLPKYCHRLETSQCDSLIKAKRSYNDFQVKRWCNNSNYIPLQTAVSACQLSPLVFHHLLSLSSMPSLSLFSTKIIYVFHHPINLICTHQLNSPVTC